MINDFGQMSDREILISVATRQELLANDFLKFTGNQSECNIKIDDRVRELELNGSKVAKDLSLSVRVIDSRLDTVETVCQKIDTELIAKKRWIDSIYAQIGIISGVVLGICAFILDIYFRIKGEP